MQVDFVVASKHTEKLKSEREAKNLLEHDIRRLLLEFTNSTGLQVVSVDVSSMEGWAKGFIGYIVKTTAQL
jgi:hypothetical protein